MKVATWNINGIKARHDRLRAWLSAHEPDVLCLQEIKSIDEAFPGEVFESLGYRLATYGQKGYNGVALFSRYPLEDVTRGFEDGEDDEQARFIGATVMADRPFRVMSAYCPNGGSLDSDKYPYKLAWYDRMLRFVDEKRAAWGDAILMGDFNVAPADIDVHDPEAWCGQVSCTAAERQRWEGIGALGMREIFREMHPDDSSYTWWDYRQLGFPKNKGMRIDHIFTTQNLADRVTACYIDRQERKGKKPSDHAPVIAEFD
ncbi:MAG: exodeoxyribonuclease III [Polyangiaceae bacterium]